MELKRYILLDNNDLIDTKGQLLDIDNLPRRFGYSSYNNDILCYFDGTLSRPLGKIVKMSDNVFELVKEGDLIVVSDSFGNENTFEVESVNLEEEVIYYYDTYSHTFMFPIEFENVVRINKKQSRQYICVWIKE